MVYIYQFCLNMFVILFEYLLLLTIFICHFCLNFDVFATLVWTYLPLLFLLLTIYIYHLCLNTFVTFVWISAFADDLYLPLLFEFWSICHFGLNMFATFAWIYFLPLFEYLLFLTIFICHFIWILIYLPLWSEYVCHFCLKIFLTFVWIFAFTDNLYLPLLFVLWYICHFCFFY